MTGTLRGPGPVLVPGSVGSGLPWTLYMRKKMVEPLLSGILLGLIPVTLSGLFVTAYLQYRRGDQLNL